VGIAHSTGMTKIYLLFGLVEAPRMAIRIHESIVAQEVLQGNLIRVVRPAN
jgi:hypothetical protein